MPTNIFKLINDNILTLSHNVDEMHKKIDMLMAIFYQNGNDDITEMPKADGEAPATV